MPKSTSHFPRRKSSSSSPFSAFPRKKTSLSRQSSETTTTTEDRLNDLGPTPSLAPPGISQDVLSLIHHIQTTTWEDIPEVAGMNSTRIGEVLRYRGTLPPIVSLAHLFALSVSPTETERELARLVAGGVVRKVGVTGRGVARGGGGGVVGEGVMVVGRWRELVDGCVGVDEGVKKKYVALMDAKSASPTTPTTGLEREEVHQLVQAGFLTNPTAVGQSSAPSMSSLLELSKSGSSAPTGSLSAIGGRGAVYEAGGGGSALSTHDRRASVSGGGSPGPVMTFSLPNTGVYLKLLTSARIHLVTLLKQLSPRFKEATMPQLKEKWDGNVLGDAGSGSVAKRARGEWSGVLAGKTKKWRDFHGLRFEAVLGECVGCGVVEVFETGIGIPGVRAR
ncbi:hypothetical protein LTR97_012623 [Elasticomyces elasticus]|uniref:Serine-threonine protein kinase 19 n=1 Tax=Elasticomyces elasticus TaxID=574655 RepID=A0AAN7VWJ9_9PEZI|nr:hypothetical protein LTR97_012623 [Elasticomyces elasticus]